MRRAVAAAEASVLAEHAIAFILPRAHRGLVLRGRRPARVLADVARQLVGAARRRRGVGLGRARLTGGEEREREVVRAHAMMTTVGEASGCNGVDRTPLIV